MERMRHNHQKDYARRISSLQLEDASEIIEEVIPEGLLLTGVEKKHAL